MNLNALVYTAEDYAIFMTIAGFSFPLLTVDTFNYDITVEEEQLWAIGQTTPIAAKTNGKTFKGSASIQVGEANTILKLAGLDTMPDIKQAYITIATKDGLFARTFSGVNILGEKFDIKAKDKNSKIPFDWHAVGVNGNLV